MQLIAAPRLGAGVDEAHLAQEDVDKLRKFIDLRLSQKIAHRKYARIILLSEDAPWQVGTVFEHGGEFEYIEVAAAQADTGRR